MVTPFIYIYVILKAPISISRSQLVFLSFFLGIVIDLFSNTLGMHAAACSLIGILRQPLLLAFVDKDLVEGITPSYQTLGTGVFMRYVLSMVVIHHLALFLIESVSLFDPGFLFLRIFTSILLTTLCIFIIEAFNIKRRSGEY
jgi:rod shape-determining protein MreD